MRIRLTVLLGLIVALPAAGQNVPRALTMPDTMGANFSIADSLKATSTPTDFDFMVGVWTFRFQQRKPDGTFNPPFTGHWTFTKKKASGTMIEDHWRADAPDQTWDDGTWTYRTFNPERNIWEMQGVNTWQGAWQPGLMWSSGADRLVIEWYGPDVVRFRYFAIGPDRFLWRADRSTDRGKTWLRDAWTMEARRVAK